MPYATNDGLRIHYEVAGTGPPLLLHHGLTGSWRDWEEFGFLDGLRDDYQLIMLDARGHGASDKPHDPSAYGFERGVADAVAVLDDLGIDRAHYYGYSYGGLMGWALGTHAPERFRSLAIGGAHPYAPDEAVWERLARMREHLAQGMETYITWRESQLGPWPPVFRQRGLENDATALAAFISFNPIEFVHLEGALDRMTMPVLIVTGDDDELYAGSRCHLAAARLRDAAIVEIPSAQHFTLYARGDLVLPHLRRFLARVVSPIMRA